MSANESGNSVVPPSDLVFVKLHHITERLTDPPSNILEQLQQIAHDSINTFDDQRVVDILKSWLTSKLKNTSLRALHFAATTLTEICPQPLSAGLLECYLHDALGLRVWVDAPDMVPFVRFLLSFLKPCDTTSDSPQEDVDAAVDLIASTITQRTQETSSIISVVRTTLTFCSLASVRSAVMPVLDRCIANAALSDLFAQLIRELAKQIALASICDDVSGGFLPSDVAVVDKLVNLQPKLKLSQLEAYYIAIKMLISHKSAPDAPVVINRYSAVHVIRLLLALDIEGKECMTAKLLLPAFNKGEFSLESRNEIASAILGEACKQYLATANKLLQLKYVIDWIMKMMRGLDHACWLSFHMPLLDSSTTNISLEILHFYSELSTTVQYSLTLDHLKAHSMKSAVPKTPVAVANRRGGAVARGRGRGGSQSGIFRQGVRDKITESEVGNATPLSSRDTAMSADQFIFLVSSLRCQYLQWLRDAMLVSESLSASRCIDLMHRILWINPSFTAKDFEKYVVVHLRDHHLMTTSALDAIVDIIATALDWCRRDAAFINFATRTNDTDAASLQPLSFVDSVMSALEFIDHNVQRSIKSEYMLCNAFLADDTNIFVKILDLLRLNVNRRKLPKSWTVPPSDAPLPLPPLTSRRLYDRAILIFCLMGAVRRDTLGNFLWKTCPSVRCAFQMMISDNYRSYTSEKMIHGSNFEPQVYCDFVSIKYNDCTVSISQKQIVLSTTESAEAALRYMEGKIWDLLHASLRKRNRRRNRINTIRSNVSPFKRKRKRQRYKKRKKKRSLPSSSPQKAEPVECQTPATTTEDPPQLEQSSKISEEVETSGPVLRRSSRIRTARFNIQELLQSDESESESELDSVESEESEVSSESESDEEATEVDLNVVDNSSDPFGLASGYYTLKCDIPREDLMFLGEIVSESNSIGRELDPASIQALRCLENKYHMAELLRQCTNPDFILLAVDEVSTESIGKTLQWLGPLLKDSIILSRIPINLKSDIFRILCREIVVAMYEWGIWASTVDCVSGDSDILHEISDCLNETLGGMDLIASLARSVADHLSDVLHSFEQDEHHTHLESFYTDLGHPSKFYRVATALSLSVLQCLMHSDQTCESLNIVLSVLAKGAYDESCFLLLDIIQRTKSADALKTTIKSALLYACNSRIVNALLMLLKKSGDSLFAYMLTFSRRQMLASSLILEQGDSIVELVSDLCAAFSSGSIHTCIPTDQYTETTLWKNTKDRKSKGKKGLEISLDAVRVLCATLATVVHNAQVPYACPLSDVPSKYPLVQIFELVCDILASAPCGYLALILKPLTCSHMCIAFPCDVLVPMLCMCDLKVSLDFAVDAIGKIYDQYATATKKMTAVFKHWVDEYTKEKLLFVASRQSQCNNQVQFILENIQPILPSIPAIVSTGDGLDVVEVDKSGDRLFKLVNDFKARKMSAKDVLDALPDNGNDTPKCVVDVLGIAADRDKSLVWHMLPYLRQAEKSTLCRVISLLPSSLVYLIPDLVHDKHIASDILYAWKSEGGTDHDPKISVLAAWYQIVSRQHCPKINELELETLLNIVTSLAEDAIARVLSLNEEKQLPLLFRRTNETSLLWTSHDFFENMIRLFMQFTIDDIKITNCVALRVFTEIVERNHSNSEWMTRLLSQLYLRHPQNVLTSVTRGDFTKLSNDDCSVYLQGVVESHCFTVALSQPFKPLHPCSLDAHISFAIAQLVKTNAGTTKEITDDCAKFLVTLADHHPMVYMQYYSDFVQILQTMAVHCERASNGGGESKSRSPTDAVSFTLVVLEGMLRMTFFTMEVAAKWERLKDALGLCLRVATATSDERISQLVRRIREQVKGADNFAYDCYMAVLEKIKCSNAASV